MKKMVIVPMKTLEEMNQWKTQHRPTLPVNPDISKTSNLQSEMGSILKRDDLNESDKSRLFGETLHKFKLSHSKAISSLPQTNISENTKPKHVHGINDDIIESIPKTMQHKGTLLLERLKQDPNIKWDEKGVLEINGKTIAGSNIIDLVNDVIRQRKQSYKPPTGWNYFSKILKDINIPKEYIGNKQRWASMQKGFDSDDDDEFFDTSNIVDSSFSFPPTPSTPSTSGIKPSTSGIKKKGRNKKGKQKWENY